jgi:hypothetical protein
MQDKQVGLSHATTPSITITGMGYISELRKTRKEMHHAG